MIGVLILDYLISIKEEKINNTFFYKTKSLQMISGLKVKIVRWKYI